jgi:hypothetical protein
MDKVTATWEMQEFTKALQEYLIESRKDTGTALNEKGVRVAFSASKQMPSAVEVKAQISTDHPKSSPLWHALATGRTSLGPNKFGTAVKGKGNKKVAEKIYASRNRHAGYSRFLFLKLASDLGGKVRAVKKLASIDNAKGQKADQNGRKDFMKAVLQILGVDQEHGSKLDRAIAQALTIEAADMRKYIEAKIAKRAQAHSGRKR